MGISPIPLRGALQRLQTEGLVEITPHSGAVVTAISQAEIGEIFLLLEALEGLAFRQAAGRVQPAELDELKRLLAEMDQAAGAVRASLEAADGQPGTTDAAVERWATANDAFHRAVAILSGMKLLAELTGRALDQWTRLRRCFRPTLAARIAAAQAEHHQMVDLLAQGDGNSLAALVVEHNHSARQAYLDSTQTPSTEEPK
jgi:DNA-binding GntR family transcriptional regulator